MKNSTSIFRSKHFKRYLFLGPTGAGKSTLVDCSYNRRIDLRSLSEPAEVSEEDRLVGKTSSISSYVDQSQKKIFVDTVGYGDARLSTDLEPFLLFLREFIYQASIGYNWLFLVLRFERLSQDILIYVEMLEEVLGPDALRRCTIVFTHCRVKDINLAKCIESNRNVPRIVGILEKVHSVIFGDMDTFLEEDMDEETRRRVSQLKEQRRQKFMEQLLAQIDSVDENTLALQESWHQSFWTHFKQIIGYLVLKIFSVPNESSRRYQLSHALKKDIPVTIFHESCSICRDLIVEVWNTEPKACVTQCGHIFHFTCLQKWFQQKKQCPNCRKDLNNLPNRLLGKLIGLHPINDEPKLPSAQLITSSAALSDVPTSIPIASNEVSSSVLVTTSEVPPAISAAADGVLPPISVTIVENSPPITIALNGVSCVNPIEFPCAGNDEELSEAICSEASNNINNNDRRRTY